MSLLLEGRYSRGSLLLEFANTCEILPLLSKGRYFRGIKLLWERTLYGTEN